MSYQLPRLNLQLLICFTAVAETGSLQKASARLGKSKSTMSRWIAELEDSLGYPLFERRSNNLVLEINQQGLALLPKVHSVIASFSRMEAFALGQDSEVAPSKLVLSFNELVTNACIADQISRLTSLYPHMELVIAPHHDDISMTALLRRDLDMVLGIVPSNVSPEIGGLTVGEEQMMLIAHPTHPLVAMPSIDSQQLVPHRLIVPRFLQHVGYNESIKPLSVIETPDFQLSLELAKNNLGIAYTPEHIARSAIRRGEVSEISTNWEEFSQHIPLMIFFPLDFNYPEIKQTLVTGLRAWFGYEP